VRRSRTEVLSLDLGDGGPVVVGAVLQILFNQFDVDGDGGFVLARHCRRRTLGPFRPLGDLKVCQMAAGVEARVDEGLWDRLVADDDPATPVERFLKKNVLSK